MHGLKVAFLTSLVALALPAHAGNYSVSPTRVDLSPKATTDVITLTNQADTPVRMEVAVKAWSQMLTDNMVLTDTTDLVVFPTLIELGPKEARQLRVGTAVPFGATEATYRILITELPALNTDGSVGLQMLSRANIPVFLAPPKRTPAGAFAGAAMVGGALEVTAINQGNVFFTVKEVRAEGTRTDGKKFATKVDGWYLLPGASLKYTLEVTKEDCPLLTAVNVEIVTTEGTYSGKAPVSPGQCTPVAAPAAASGGR